MPTVVEESSRSYLFIEMIIPDINKTELYLMTPIRELKRIRDMSPGTIEVRLNELE